MTPFPATLAPLISHIRRMLMSAIFVAAVLPLTAQTPGAQTATLPGHVLGILPKATHLSRDPERENDIVTAEVVLRLSDEAGFKAFMAELEDPDSPNYHHPLQPNEVTARFGPSQEAYDKALDYLEQYGLKLAVGSKNRRVLTVRGTRAQAEKAFHVQIDDYQLGDRKFHAVAADPSVSSEIAPLILGVSGLSNLGRWQPFNAPTPASPASIETAYHGSLTSAGLTNSGGLPPGLDGAGQTIGIIALEDYNIADIQTWLAFAGLPPDLANNVHRFNVDGGPSVPAGQVEPVLDIDAVLGTAPGANVMVFGGPYSDQASDYSTIINAAIDNVGFGGTLSLSYGMCESQVTASDANSMDSLLQSAAASGITMFAATGDTGSSCKDGTSLIANTIPYPVDAPHAVAVGGTTLHVHSDNTYKSENWWNDIAGAGGFGNSIYTTALGETLIERSVPDVAFDADYFSGMDVCLSTNDPVCFLVGGTSMAAPMWAGLWSLVNQANADGARLPFSAANGYLTTIPNAFHSPFDMSGTGNDTAHLGMGTPNVTDLAAIAGPPVTVLSVNPNSGTAAGGTKVTVLGQGFLGVKKVTFGGVDGTNLTIYSDSVLTIDSPVAPSAQTDIQVENPAGTSAKVGSDVFHYVPELKTISPNHGPLAGGNTVTVTGVGLSSKHGFKYSFGGVDATKVSCSGPATCTMEVPMHGLGSVELTIDTPVGNSPKSLKYTYGAPAISSFNPTVGPTTGDVRVTINGSNLATGMTVEFGDTAVTGVVCGDPTYCWVNNPAVSAPESVHLSATVDDVTSAPSAGEFAFEVFPTVTGINPGQANAGTVVTLTGTGFGVLPAGAVAKAQLAPKNPVPNPTWFSFWGINVQGACSSSTQCTAVVPASSAGPGGTTAVTVTVDGDTSTDWVEFSYPGKPIVPPCKGTTCS
jgi:hypothetical protein